MIIIHWIKDYQREFTCPYCHQVGLKLSGKSQSSQQRFCCSNCQKQVQESCEIKVEKFVDINHIVWYKGYQIDGFVCSHLNCQGRDIYFERFAKNKKHFRCRKCQRFTSESIELTQRNLSRFAQKFNQVTPFNFQDDRWDLRAILTSVFDNNSNRFIAHFEEVQPDWFKLLVKKYIYHLCKLDKPSSTLLTHLSNLRFFSRYIISANIREFSDINRSVIINFITSEKKHTGEEGIRHRLGVLRNFFFIGNAQGWFEMSDQDIIRWGDSPKRRENNPDPIPDTVREQIEKNLHKLPDPIARMWIIAFFTAMRPAEARLLEERLLSSRRQLLEDSLEPEKRERPTRSTCDKNSCKSCH
ncbi:hypothetical protein [Scytonema sp. UIC 10036]|uniref:hypothetical protein n=1 Tax=Scytonema sp. UIC 10036 TaxID=2304196 RepID=UPI001A9BE538|nr:hypothetical protein [Scytonema sp. UIC 10036]